MDEFLKKLGTYDMFVNFIPGCLFTWYLQNYRKVFYISDDGVISIINMTVVCYMIGLLINRIGSLLVEPLLKKVKLVNFAPYYDFIEAEKKDEKIKQLSEVNNFYRSLISFIIITIVFEIAYNYEAIIIFVGSNSLFLLTIVLAVFLLSYRKQTNYITKRVEKALNDKDAK